MKAETNSPKIYVASLTDYNSGRLEGQWIDFDDYNDGYEIMNAIKDMLEELNEKYKDDENREEWAIHDYEGFPSSMYSEYMGEEDFQAIYDIKDVAEDRNIDFDVLMERASDVGSDDYESIADSLFMVVSGNDETDIVYQYEDELGELGKDFWSNHTYLTATDKRLLQGEEEDRYREDLIHEGMSEDEAEEKAEEMAEEEIQRMEDDLMGYLDEMGYEEIPNWVSKDYDSAWRELSYDYDVVYTDDEMFVFNNSYGVGGAVLSGVVGAYIGYKIGRARPQKKGFETEKKIGRKIKQTAKEVRGKKKMANGGEIYGYLSHNIDKAYLNASKKDELFLRVEKNDNLKEYPIKTKTLRGIDNQIAEFYEDDDVQNVSLIRYWNSSKKGGIDDVTHFAKGGSTYGGGKKYYWITMDKDLIDEYIGYASRMNNMYDGEIYTQAPNKVAFETDDDRFNFTSMLENEDLDYEYLYDGEPRMNIFDKISQKNYAKGGKLWIDSGKQNVQTRGTKGTFRAKADRQGLSSGQLADKILKNPSKYSKGERKSAQFVENIGVKEDGGVLGEKDRDYLESMLYMSKGESKKQGYSISQLQKMLDEQNGDYQDERKMKSEMQDYWDSQNFAKGGEVKTFEVGDKVKLTLKGIQQFNRNRSVNKFSNEFSRKLGKLKDDNEVGVVERVFDSGGMNVVFKGTTFDIKPYMVESYAKGGGVDDKEYRINKLKSKIDFYGNEDIAEEYRKELKEDYGIDYAKGGSLQRALKRINETKRRYAKRDAELREKYNNEKFEKFKRGDAKTFGAYAKGGEVKVGDTIYEAVYTDEDGDRHSVGIVANSESEAKSKAKETERFTYIKDGEKIRDAQHLNNYISYFDGKILKSNNFAKGGGIKKYKVRSEINDDIEYFNTKKEVDEYIKSELKLANVYEKRSPYTEDDFIIENTSNNYAKGGNISYDVSDLING